MTVRFRSTARSFTCSGSVSIAPESRPSHQFKLIIFSVPKCETPAGVPSDDAGFVGTFPANDFGLTARSLHPAEVRFALSEADFKAARQCQTYCNDRQAIPPPPSETGRQRRAEAGPSPPLRLVIAGRGRQTAAIRQARRRYENAAAMTGVALTIFSHSDPATGDHEICILTSETGYFELERQAQRRGKTVEDIFTAKWRMPSPRYNVTPDCFYVTAGRSGAFDTGSPPAHPSNSVLGCGATTPQDYPQ